MEECESVSDRKLCFFSQPIPTDMWVKMMQTRVKMFDCVKKGYVMDGFPETREQAQALQAAGIFPSHCGKDYF